MRCWLYALGVIISVALPNLAMAYDVETLAEVGPSSNRIDVVFMGDGYREADQAQLTADVQAFLQALWDTSPFDEYRDYFNIKVIHVISTQNGADGGSYGANRDTALGAYYNCYNISQLICFDTFAAYTILADHTPGYDAAFIMVNDATYGGSGGDISVMSVNAASAEIGLHEFGHSFANLADEYDDAYPGYPLCSDECPEPNVTPKHTRATVKWNAWIDAATPIPTPETGAYADDVGAFEGARYQTSGLYRPVQDCKMRILGVPYCPVCTEANVWAVYNRISPLDTATPASPIVTESCEPIDFTVTHPTKVTSPLVVRWFVDGVATGASGDTFRWGLLGAHAGTYSIVARIEDDTALVKNDAESLLREDVTWSLTLNYDCAQTCTIDAAIVPGGVLNPENPCESCLPGLSQVAWSPLEGVACADDLFCNGTEMCVAGTCTSQAPACSEDGLACTSTLCDEAGQRCNPIDADACLVAGQCYSAGESPAHDPCRTCQPSQSQSALSDAEGVACDDGNDCTLGDHCQAGLCVSGTNQCGHDGAPQVPTTTAKSAGCGCYAIEPSNGFAWAAFVIGSAAMRALGRRRRRWLG